ncbi:glycosyltransferase family 2 protein [Aquibaculum arenosum]|uniref:Glycosyltransferase family 2 protein n=1 Tax=Aquibaculum arenosum TaxID=3032591 RepID=A0ABT5YNZ8_9PROT|nr:glycosyltransferase family 2 protein [Fodinicurvata sp. CAU 1616]MDF2096607.1 glycosyltransferase family 2 protein [Fodinicurvata sp. CAU 1616]
MNACVTILLPAYHAAATLPRAVSSLLAQSREDWTAVIASDDGRDYLALLAEQGLGDARLRQVSTGHTGSGDHGARNAALQAVGDTPFIATLDADDAWAPQRLAELMPLAEEAGAAVCNTLTHDESGHAYKRPFPDARAPFAMTAEDILSPRSPFFPLFRRELAGAGWPAVPFCSDVLLSLGLLDRTRRAGGALLCHPEPLYHYYKTPGSMTHDAGTAGLADAGYGAIFDLLADPAFPLADDIRAAAQAEFTRNRQSNAVFARWLVEGRCTSLEDFLDRTENGRAAWLFEEGRS